MDYNWNYLGDMEIHADDISDISVTAQDDMLRGTPSENKKVFDNLPKFLVDRINSILYAVDQKQAENATLHGGLSSSVQELATQVASLTTATSPSGTPAKTAYNKDFATTNPLKDGVANCGSAQTVARGDHIHPTDDSRASKSELDSVVTRVTTIEGKINTATLTISAETIEIYQAMGMETAEQNEV